jgi:hypothetical protein
MFRQNGGAPDEHQVRSVAVIRMKKRVLIFWRRVVVVKREEQKFPPYVPPQRTVVRRPPRERWWLWWRVLGVLRIKKYHFPPYVPPRPVVPVQVTTVIVGGGARREPWRWWMLFTRRGADMTIPEWLEDKKLAVMEWPLMWKLGMALPGILGGWLLSLQTGWHPKRCMFFGGLLGMFSPFFFIGLLEWVFGLTIFCLFFGAIYWAFKDTEDMQFIAEKMGIVLAGLWGLIAKLWHAIFG